MKIDGIDLDPGSLIENATLTGKKLNMAMLTGARIISSDFSDSEMRYAKLGDAILNNSTFERVDFSGAYLVLAKMVGSNFSQAVFINADLDQTICTMADMSDVSLINVQLNESDLRGVNFNRCSLMDSSLRKCKMQYSNMSESVLQKTDFMESDMHGVTFILSDLRWSNLTNCVLDHCDFYQAIRRNSLILLRSASCTGLPGPIRKEMRLRSVGDFWRSSALHLLIPGKTHLEEHHQGDDDKEDHCLGLAHPFIPDTSIESIVNIQRQHGRCLARCAGGQGKVLVEKFE
jgi:uncharacterized protein YjbI with pentapeptide repeats